MAGTIDNPHIGDFIAHYKIIKKLGEGGMGVVYKAKDTKLQRTVALKFLPPEFTRDAEAKERFMREAQAASSLEHINICNIHEIQQTKEGRLFIVMANYSGESLDEKIKKAPLELKEAVDFATQIAQGLARAHEQGIVHRDIKSANMLITDDNIVKILDFGLAKLGDNSKLTKEHTIMGTLNYVSPEQLQGTDVDHRADIWSFGVVFYEMLTGQLPFKNEHDPAVMYAIINEDPAPITALRAKMPVGLVRIVNKALQKEKEDRYQHMNDLLSDLQKMDNEALKNTSRINIPLLPVKVKKKLKKMTPVAAVLVAMAATTIFVRSIEKKSVLQTMLSKPLINVNGAAIHPAFSRDGKHIAYAWNTGSGNDYDIYVQTIDGRNKKRLTEHPGSDTHPIWTEDGSAIFFRRFYNGQVSLHLFYIYTHKEVFLYSFRPVEKGPNPFVFATRLREHNQIIHPLSPLPPNSFALLQDNETIIGRNQANSESTYYLIAYNWKTKKVDTLTTPEKGSYGDFLLALSPDRKKIAFTRYSVGERGHLYVQPLNGSEPKRLTPEELNISSLAWTADSREIIFSHSGTNLHYTSSHGLWKIPATGGTPIQIIPGTQHAQNPAISLQGHLMAYCQGPTRASAFYKLFLNNVTEKMGVEKIALLSKSENSGDISPDGKKIACRSDRNWSEEIWISDLEGNDLKQVTASSDSIRGKGSPRWCPDSRRIAFDAFPINDRNRNIYIIDTITGIQQQLTTHPEYDAIPQWSMDGEWVYFRSERSGDEQIWKIPSGGGKAVQITFNGGYHLMESPDGKWLYFTKRNDKGIWRIPPSGGDEQLIITERDQLKNGQLYKKQWTVVEQGIYFMRMLENNSKFTIEFFDFASNETIIIHEEKGEPGLHIDVTPDGSTLLFSKTEGTSSDIMIVENFE